MAPWKPKNQSIQQLPHVRVCIGTRHCAFQVYFASDDWYKMEPMVIEGNVFVRISNATSIDSDSRAEMNNSTDMLKVLTDEWNDWMKRSIADSMEVELDFTDPLEVQETASGLKNLLKGPKFRVEKLVFNNGTARGFQQAIVDLCDRKYLKLIHKRIIHPDAQSVYPMYVLDQCVPNYLDGLPMRCSHIFLKWKHYDTLIKELVQLARNDEVGTCWTLRALHQEPYKALSHGRETFYIQKVENGMQRLDPIGNVMLRHKVTDCGYYADAVRIIGGESYDWDGERCGLAEFCANCQDPFEHDMFHDLPRRVLEDWTHVFVPISDEAERQRMFSKLGFFIQKTTPIGVRRGVRVGPVNFLENPIFPFLSMYKSEFLWLLISCLITLIISYFFPDLLNPCFLFLGVFLLPKVKVILLIMLNLIIKLITFIFYPLFRFL